MITFEHGDIVELKGSLELLYSENNGGCYRLEFLSNSTWKLVPIWPRLMPSEITVPSNQEGVILVKTDTILRHGRECCLFYIDYGTFNYVRHKFKYNYIKNKIEVLYLLPNNKWINQELVYKIA